ncbi:hypothetical protein FQN53_000985 [Emmonsiellopsis sp. PD_33]|nr:hypothetical protein FQN53_000985 [Emmonsiellopsis sp. PD_33]
MPPHSHRDHFIEPPSLVSRLSAALPPRARAVITTLAARAQILATSYAREARRSRQTSGVFGILRRLCSVQNVLVLVWIVTLWWGERKVFRDSVGGCGWGGWESWPQDALPHRVIFVADPQLVDPHTYPGRPWPLSSLTVFYADLYLYRTYSLLQRELRPDTTFFLGDLFDGGREWGTESSTSPEERFREYDNKVWLKEYRRFVRLFLDTWKQGGIDSASSERGRKIIASLPGNHDLGFGHGIQRPVLERFQTYFGVGNRVDVLGNHTFVSVDSVSLSAMDQPDPETGSNTPSPDKPQGEEIWRAADNFLNDLRTIMPRATKEELLALQGEAENYLAPANVVDADNPAQPEISSAPSDVEFPTIILTHVPFYRAPGTPCGPLRERFPPSSTNPLPEKDERNAIKVTKGYQYQNVLTQTISNKIISNAGQSVKQIYSGDDHDYCEINHREFRDSPKEITVKSISLAMGVRRPGFQMASLYNPVDLQTGKPITQSSPSSHSSTIQNHLCLLPDQVSIFIQYAYIFVLAALVLFLRAITRSFRPNTNTSTNTHSLDPLLPISNQHRFTASDDSHLSSTSSTSTTSSSSPSYQGENRFASRGNGNTGNGMLSRTASSSPPVGHVQNIGPSGGDDEVSKSLRRADWEVDEKEKKDREREWGWGWASIKGGSRSYEAAAGSNRGWRYVMRTEFLSPLKRVAGVAVLWYLWLVWTW